MAYKAPSLRQQPLRMNAGGLVPGSGKGDKVPALLEPGEFVVSNDMLRQAPGLRSELRGLRDAALAKKGMSPAEADAQAYEGVRRGRKEAEFLEGRSAELDDPSPMGHGGLRGLEFSDPHQGRVGHPGALRAVNGIEVTELPWNSSHSRTFATSPGPGNPNVTAAGSAEAQAFRAAQAAPPAAQPAAPTAQAAAPTTQHKGRIAQARAATSNFFTGPGSSGGSVGGAFKNVGQPLARVGSTVLRGAGRVAPYAVAGQAAADGFGTDTERYAKRFGLEDTEPGILRDVGIRALGVASDLGNAMSFGVLGDRLFRDKLDAPAQPAAQPRPVTAPAPAVAADPVAASKPSGTEIMPGVFRDGAPGLRGTSYANVGTPDTPEVIAQRAAEHRAEFLRQQEYFDRERAAREQAQAQHDAGLAQSQRVADEQADAIRRERALRDATVRAGSIDPRTARVGAEELKAIQAGNLAARNNAAGIEKARMDQATTQRGQDLTAQTLRRGQDMTLAGAQASAQTQAARLRYDMIKGERDFAAQSGDKAFEQRQSADKAQNELFQTMFRTKGDKGEDVPDTARIAQFTNDLQDTIPQLIEGLTAKGSPEALRTAQELSTKGFAALGAEDRAKFKQLSDIKARVEQTRGVIIGSTNARSMGLAGYEQMPGTDASDGYIHLKNGIKVPVKHMLYDEPGNLVLPDWFKSKTDQFTRGMNLRDQ